MSQTKQEIRQEWDRQNLKKYNVSFHRNYNRDLIEYVEAEKNKGRGTSEIFKDAISTLMDKKE